VILLVGTNALCPGLIMSSKKAHTRLTKCNISGVTVVAMVASTLHVQCSLQEKPSSSEFQIQICTLFEFSYLCHLPLVKEHQFFNTNEAI
jgi:hypothetical protein